MYVCPHCQKQVKDLKDHLKRMHPDKVEKVKPPTKPLEFEVKKPEPKTKPKEETEETSEQYHCLSCGNSITRGQIQCPHCSVTLDWSAI